jgi:hypothetical protein
VSLRLWRLAPAVLAEVDKVFPARFLRLSVGNGTIGTVKKTSPSHQVVLVALRSSDQYYYRMCTFNVNLESHQRLKTRKKIPLVPFYAFTVQERRVVKGQLAGKVARKYAAVIVATELLRNTG